MAESCNDEQEEQTQSQLLNTFNLNLTKIIAVKSPCIVENMDKYLAMLGSREERDEIFENREDKLPFRFRPEDSHSKPAFADPLKCSAIVIKVRVPKSARSAECRIECLGVVQTMYKYKRPFDYQFLSPALHPLPSQYPLDQFSPHHNVIDSVQLKGDMPLFVLPSSNPRLDWASLSFKPTEKESSGRVRTFEFVYGIPFEEPSVPTVPRKQVQAKAYLLPMLEALFQERPIWSRVALNCRTGADPGSLRSALSTLAYHFSSGPWKYNWIKFGVDPREHPKYKWYQVVECRITKLRRARSKALQISDYSFASSITEEEFSRGTACSRTLPEYMTNPKSYILSLETTPDSARLSYQLIDIELDSVRDLISSTDGEETVCTKETGWFSAKVYEQIKTVIRELFD